MQRNSKLMLKCSTVIILPKVIYGFIIIPVKISGQVKYCVEINNLLLKLYRKVKEVEEPKQFWKKSLDSRLLISRLSYSKTAYNRQKESQQITDIERSSEIGIHIYIHMYIRAQMIFDKDAKTTHQETF